MKSAGSSHSKAVMNSWSSIPNEYVVWLWIARDSWPIADVLVHRPLPVLVGERVPGAHLHEGIDDEVRRALADDLPRAPGARVLRCLRRREVRVRRLEPARERRRVERGAELAEVLVALGDLPEEEVGRPAARPWSSTRGGSKRGANVLDHLGERVLARLALVLGSRRHAGWTRKKRVGEVLAVHRGHASASRRRRTPGAWPGWPNDAPNSHGQLKRLPASPGVYLFRDAAGDVLYVGKAKSLRARVRQYFQAGRSDTRARDRQLVERVADVETIVTGNEVEALHLEQNLVKRHRPPFNVRLRDDKSFPYIAVTVEDDYPRVMFTRERHRRGVVYFGPYANAKKVRETLDVLNRVFRYRPCEGPQPGGTAASPASTTTSSAASRRASATSRRRTTGRSSSSVIEFLSGDDAADRARSRAEDARRPPTDERFEEAARYRNRLFAVRHLAERQAADERAVGTIDVIGIAVEGDRAAVQVFPLRDGKLVDRYSFHLENVEGQDPATLLEAFCLEYYGSSPQCSAADRGAAGRGGHLRAGGVPLGAARLAGRGPRGRARREAPARRSSPSRTRGSRSSRSRPVAEPKRAAARGGARGAARGAQPGGLPIRIECFDISNIQGASTGRLDGGVRGRDAEEVALPQVRRRGVDGQDDFASMAEVVARRFARLGAGATAEQYDDSFAATPNLVVDRRR